MSSNHFVFDVETCAVESTAICLSAAIVYFDPTEDVSYQELVDRSLFVKFDSREQASAGRIATRDTIDWWNKQSEAIRNLSFKKSNQDVSTITGIQRLIEYVKEHGNKNSFMWARGSLDQLVIESLCRSVGSDGIIHYNSWMDVRTAIRLIKETSTHTGYCTIPDFNIDQVDKHNPIADVCYDALMLAKGA